MENYVKLVVEGRFDGGSKTPQTSPISFTADCVWGLSHSHSRVSLFKDQCILARLSGTEFYTLCNKVRSSNYNDLKTILQKNKVEIFTITDNIIEQDLIKAICNIFIWLEYYFMESDIAPDTKNLLNNSEFLPKMYNEFITDLYSDGTSLKDIYLLDQKHKFGTQGIAQLDKLVELKLLTKVTLTVRNETYTNYFLPFTKKNNYKEVLIQYPALLQLFNQILRERDECLINFFKNR